MAPPLWTVLDAWNGMSFLSIIFTDIMTTVRLLTGPLWTPSDWTPIATAQLSSHVAHMSTGIMFRFDFGRHHGARYT
jgi:hypothetical protein